jgi:Spy/CpxP family protein refolding chaperone
MKRQLTRLAAVGTMAAGMIFAQAQTTQQAPAGSRNQAQAAQGKVAHGQNAMHNRRSEAHKRMMAALNLTPEQKTAAKAIFSQARETSKPVRMELKQNREAMAAAVKADNKARIEQLSGERGRLMAKLTTNRTEAMAKFYQALTPAQRAKAEQMKANFQARMQRLRGERRGTRTNG